MIKIAHAAVESGKITIMEDKIKSLRKQIDALDDNIMELLRQRADLARAVGGIKNSNDAQGFARLEREADILRRLSNNSGRLSEAATQAIYREIISACLALEKPQKIAYLGPSYTFTHSAACKNFGSSAVYEPTESIEDALRQVEKGHCDFAVVPFENSSEGTVSDTVHALLDFPLSLCGEIMLRIHHHLLAPPGTTLSAIKAIYAHPQALAQCRVWLQRNAPQAACFPMQSNAAAACHVAERGEQNIAAIASQLAARHYQLQEIAADIEDSSFNTTRFFVVGATSPPPSEQNKTSLIVAASDKAGALYYLLEPFNRLGINMTKFESRPMRGQLWQYIFFIDIDGHQQDAKVAQALSEISARAAFLKSLGSYPKALE